MSNQYTSTFATQARKNRRAKVQSRLVKKIRTGTQPNGSGEHATARALARSGILGEGWVVLHPTGGEQIGYQHTEEAARRDAGSWATIKRVWDVK